MHQHAFVTKHFIPTGRLGLAVVATATFLAAALPASGNPALAGGRMPKPGNDEAVRCDFDGDGRAEIAVGSPGDNDGEGAVYITLRDIDGVFISKAFRHGQNVDGIAVEGDRFGAALACGDFDGDGYSDLAIGSPGADDGAGYVNILYGSKIYGLQERPGDDRIAQNLPTVDEMGEKDDFFGQALAAGDFNRDGVDDLAVGAPGENSSGLDTEHVGGSFSDQGIVHVFYGVAEGAQPTPNPIEPGLSTQYSQLFHPNMLMGTIPGNAAYGWALASGDFDSDGVDDLAVGAPGAAVFTSQDSYALQAGKAQVLFGVAGPVPGPGGLTLMNNHVVAQSSFYNTPFENELFGFSLAAGNFDGRGGDELAVGVPFDYLAYATEKGHFGSVHILGFGGQADVIETQYWSQRRLGGAPEAYDRFGFSLVAGDFDGSGHEDLAMSVPFQHVYKQGESARGGAVSVLYGNSDGLGSTTSQTLSLGGVSWYDTGVDDFQHFGFALGALDIHGDGVSDLVIGIPGWDNSDEKVENAGAVIVARGVAEKGLDPMAGFLHQGSVEPNASFGPEPSDEDVVLPLLDGGFNSQTGERYGNAIAN